MTVVEKALASAPVFKPQDTIPPGAISPKVWEFVDPKGLARRDWLYDRLLCRGYLSVTIAPGGVGKSTLSLTESLAMVTGKPLLVPSVSKRPLKVWEINLEDSLDECNRRLAAVCKHYSLKPEDVEGRYFLSSGLDAELNLATLRRPGKAEVLEEVFSHLERTIRTHGIDVLKIDPFVSAHDLPENDNIMIDRLAKRLARLAYDCNIAVHVTHHTRKSGNGSTEHDAESSRGASSLVNAARVVRVINRVPKKEAQALGIADLNRKAFVKITNDKQNLAPATSGARYLKMRSIGLGNGTPPGFFDQDEVGVFELWQPTDPASDIEPETWERLGDLVAAGNLAANSNAEDWAGHAIAPLIGLDTTKDDDRATMRRRLKNWLAMCVFRRTVELCPRARKERPFIRLGDAFPIKGKGSPPLAQ